jgi:exodeoxyribonuclease-3
MYGWIARESPDFLCLQETKAHYDQLSAELRAPVDGEGNPYFVYWAQAQRRGYSGTAIFSRREARSFTFLGVDEFDAEGRVVAADYGDFTLVSAYFPNSQDAGARIDYKIRFCDAMLAYCDRLVAEGRNVVVAGDYNIAHEPIDLARPKENEGTAGYLPEERAWMTKYLDAGYADTFRRLHSEPRNYSWWTYRVPSARENNIGWRIDYHCVNEAFMSAVNGAAIHPGVTGSDHCPVSLELDI